MAARAGMTDRIAELRELTNAGTASYSIAGVNYFSDDQLQAVLDEHRADFYRQPLNSEPVFQNSTTHWYDYYFSQRKVEQQDTGGGTTTAWRIETSQGSVIGTALYAVNYDAGHVSFGTVDQMGTAYYLTGRQYDLNRAAAQVWRKRAAYEQQSADWQSDNHRVAASQRYKAAIEMAKFFEGQARSANSKIKVMRRTDVSPR